MRQLLIFVEGDYDEKIISALGFGSELMIRRGPGKKGLKAYMQGYANASRVLQSTYGIGFRDRDFDYPVPETPSLIIPSSDKGKVLVTYRTTIENYLISPENYQHFLASDPDRRYAKLSVDQFSSFMNSAAREIRFFQAARHALGACRGENALETSWMAKSGMLPNTLSRDACFAAASDLLASYGARAQRIADHEAFVNTFESFCARFDDAFIEEGQYLVWFQGKDLAASMSRLIADEIQDFPWKIFYRTAIQHFDFTQFPDLVALRQHLDAIIKGENT